METKTLPAHAVFDQGGMVVSIILLNGKTPEFYQVERMAFDDIGGFLKDLTPKKNEKTIKEGGTSRASGVPEGNKE